MKVDIEQLMVIFMDLLDENNLESFSKNREVGKYRYSLHCSKYKKRQ